MSGWVAGYVRASRQAGRQAELSKEEEKGLGILVIGGFRKG